MPDKPPEHDAETVLLAQAIAGDRDALGRLLILTEPRVLRFVAGQTPTDLRATVAAEDICQEAYRDAFRRIGQLRATDTADFEGWILTIARHRLIDAIRAHRADKRGGQFHKLSQGPANSEDSLDTLLEAVRPHDHTPSRSAAGHEAVAALSTAIEELPPDLRTAIKLRYFDGLCVADIAQRMDRTDRAIHNLCTRGLRQLRDSMGPRDRFFSSEI